MAEKEIILWPLRYYLIFKFFLKAPEPLKRSWPGMLRVGEFANSCETTRIMPVVQEHGEDCLYLNIYVPSLYNFARNSK